MADIAWANSVEQAKVKENIARADKSIMQHHREWKAAVNRINAMKQKFHDVITSKRDVLVSHLRQLEAESLAIDLSSCGLRGPTDEEIESQFQETQDLSDV